jgi:hypothetical protein
MVAALHILRIGLVLLTAFFGLILYAEFTGHAIYDDARLVRAFTEDRTASTAATQQELEAATTAHHKKRFIVAAVEVLLFGAASWGIVYSTHAIRARTI